MHKQCIPGGSECNSLRKNSSIISHQTMQCFFKSNDGNAQPGFFNKKFLNSVDVLLCVHLQSENAIPVFFFSFIGVAGYHEELPEFFFDSHSRKQVFYPFLYWQ